MAGYRAPAASRCPLTWLASVWAARSSIPSLTSRLSDTIVPSPRPGNTKTLFACPTSCRTPAWSTGPNGDPVATSARPSVQARMSAGVASAFDVGLDSGMISGWRTPAAVARTIASPNVPAVAVVPTSTVGRRARTMAVRWSGETPVPLPMSAIAAAWSASASIANSRFDASRSARRLWTRPCESTSTICRPMASPDSPASRIASLSSRAMPMPAAPAPTSSTRTSARVARCARSAARTPATTTTAVPWMSSLKDGTRWR